MRRAGPKNRKRKYRWKLAGVLLAAAAMFAAVDSQLRPVVETMAQYQCRVVSVIAINEAVMDELEKMGDVPHRLVHLEKNVDGTVSNVELDSVEMNRLKARLTEAVSNRLTGLENQDVAIPLGTLLGWQLLAGRGPDIHLQIVPASFVESEVVDTLESAGINQTQHRVCIRFTVEMSAILPGYSTSVDVTDEVCVAQTLIVGQVPEFYAQNG